MSHDRYAEATARIVTRIRATADERATGFPHFADPDTGAWTRSPAGDWTGGYWVGQLWLAAEADRDEGLRDQARLWSARLEPRLTSDTIFRGFMFWYGAALGAILADDPAAQALAF